VRNKDSVRWPRQTEFRKAPGLIWKTEKWLEPNELGPPQLDSARTVPIGTRTNGSGNRVSVKR